MPEKISRRSALKLAVGAAATAALNSIPGDSDQRDVLDKTKPKNLETTLANNCLKALDSIFTLEVEGAGNLKDTDGKRLIFLTTHLSDLDVGLAIAGLSKSGIKNLKVAQLSTHFNFLQNPGGYVGRIVGGTENSFPVSHRLAAPERTVFQPTDLEPMKNALIEGYAMVMAAYFNLKKTYKEGKQELPDKGGSGGVYLAQITPNSVMVPISIDIQTPEPIAMGGPKITELLKYKGAKVRIKIGKPIEPTPIPQVAELKTILHKRAHKEALTEEDREEFVRIHHEIKRESDRVMHELQTMLPQEKRAKNTDFSPREY